MEELTILNVPFSEKDEAKLLSARWNPNIKKWYVPIGVNLSLFEKWMLVENEFALPPLFIVKSAQECWKCSQPSDVYCIASSGFLDEDGTDNEFTTFSNLENIGIQVETLIQEYIPLYKLDYSKTVEGVYYMNHCQNCSVKLGDFFMHSEPGGAFFPMSENSATKIIIFQLSAINKKVAISGSPGYQSPDFINLYAERKKL